MKITTEKLTEIVGRKVLDEGNVLDEYTKAEFSSIEKIKDNGHYCVVKVVVAKGKSFFNTVFANQEFAVIIIDSQVEDVTEYEEEDYILHVYDEDRMIYNDDLGEEVYVTIKVEGETAVLTSTVTRTQKLVGKENISYNDESLLEFVNKHSRIHKSLVIHH